MRRYYKDSFENLKDIIQALDIEKLPGKRKPTWFELITLYAFLCFRNENIDWGVFEVGLGGRLDSTNIIMPEFCIITPIELEHTEYLGNTLEKIAFEKSGIFKKNVPVFSAKQDDCVRKVLKQRANDIKTSIIFFDEIQTHNDLFLHIKQEKLRLQGKIQYENAQLAAFAIKTTLPHIDSKSIIQGIKQAFLPCRLETMLTRIQNKTISLVLDGSHTPKSLSLCLEAFFEQYGSDNHLLFACASDKDVNAMARIIKTSDCNFSDITLTIPGNIPRANFEKTHSAFCAYDDRQSIHGSENYEDSIRGAIAKAGTKQKTLLCVGSFYLCAEVKKISEDF
ncbi:MAG: Mur ligase family protein [Spirochaetales bacterium]